MWEWRTYTLSDFLMFSQQTYYRLFELYNSAIWPLQILAIALGIALGILTLLCLRHGGARQAKLVAALLAACWLWVAWAYHIERFATIHWAARYFALGFGFEALLLVWLGIVRGPLSFEAAGNAVRRAGIFLFLFALLVQPLIGPATGRPWRQAEIFGIAPDPTVVATLGIVLMSGHGRTALLAIPLMWCIVSGATLWAMHARDALLMPLIAALVSVMAIRGRK
jgi:hypothetical protein